MKTFLYDPSIREKLCLFVLTNDSVPCQVFLSDWSTLSYASKFSLTFGFFKKDFLVISHIIILCKQVIFQCRNLNIKPSLSLLKAKIKITHKLELSIA